MLRIPPEGHAVRSLIDVKVVEALTPESVAELPAVPEARVIAREYFRVVATPLARQFGGASTIHNVLTRSDDGRVILVGFGPRGSFRVRWNFGRVENVPSFLKMPPKITAAATAIVEAAVKNGRLKP